jgi:hypothetical protein
VPAAVGIPEITPVDGLMVSPGGRPDAEKLVPAWVAVTVKLNGVPELPVAWDMELTRGVELARISCTTWIRPEELNWEDGTMPEART